MFDKLDDVEKYIEAIDYKTLTLDELATYIKIIIMLQDHQAAIIEKNRIADMILHSH